MIEQVLKEHGITLESKARGQYSETQPPPEIYARKPAEATRKHPVVSTATGYAVMSLLNREIATARELNRKDELARLDHLSYMWNSWQEILTKIEEDEISYSKDMIRKMVGENHPRVVNFLENFQNQVRAGNTNPAIQKDLVNYCAWYKKDGKLPRDSESSSSTWTGQSWWSRSKDREGFHTRSLLYAKAAGQHGKYSDLPREILMYDQAGGKVTIPMEGIIREIADRQGLSMQPPRQSLFSQTVPVPTRESLKSISGESSSTLQSRVKAASQKRKSDGMPEKTSSKRAATPAKKSKARR